MAKLPQFVSEARLPETAGAAEIDRRFPIDSTGRALATLGDKAVDVAGTALVAAAHARQEGEVTRAIADTTQKLDTLRLELDKDPDYLGREAKFNAAARAIESEAVGTLSGAAANAYRQKLAGLYASQAHSVRWQAVKDQNDALRVELDGNTDTMIESALATRNKAERLAKLGEIDDALKRAQETGVITGAQYLQWKKAKLEKFDEITVTRVMRTAPGTALQLLADKSATPNLDPLRREQLKIQATARGRQMSALAKSDARAEVASAIDAFGRGNLNPSNLETARLKARAFPELSKQLGHAEYVYGQTADFATKSQAEQADLIGAMRRDEGRGSATPTDTALRDAYEKIYAATAKAYRQDPGATAMQRNTPGAERLALAERAYADAPTPEAREDAGARFRQALLDLQHFQQTDGGLPPVMTRLLPKATADMLETNFNKLAGQERLTFLEAQRNKYGALWPEIYAQLNEGKRLPADVKILGAINGPFRANQSAALIQQALAIPESKRGELVPEEGVRKRIPVLVGEAAQPLRETMRRVPGEAEAYTDYADAIARTAEFLLGTKRAPSPESAVRQAYKLIVDDNWATAGSVRIPKIEGRPIADPTAIAAYGEYLRRNLDQYYLAVPDAQGPLAQVPELRRLQMWRDHLKAYGSLTADRFEQGVVLRDGDGRIVRGQNGQAISATWDEIARDKDFQAWRAQGGRPDRMQPTVRERFGNMPGMLPGPEAR